MAKQAILLLINFFRYIKIVKKILNIIIFINSINKI